MATHLKSHQQRRIAVPGGMPRSSDTSRPSDFGVSHARSGASRNRATAALFDPNRAPRYAGDSSPMPLMAACCQVRAGHPEAFASLMAQCGPQMKPYRRWCHQASDAADLQQELWTALFVALKGRPPRTIETWCKNGGDTHDC